MGPWQHLCQLRRRAVRQADEVKATSEGLNSSIQFSQKTTPPTRIAEPSGIGGALCKPSFSTCTGNLTRADSSRAVTSEASRRELSQPTAPFLESELIAALTGIGIKPTRYQSILDVVRSGSDSSFEINLNEAQKLDILHIDSTE